MSFGIQGISQALAAVGPGHDGILIGVVDGIPDLDCEALAGEDISVEATMTAGLSQEPDAHGTEICSLIFGKDFGLANGCRGLVLPIFFPAVRGSKPARASQMDMARALYMAVERGAAIANVSAGQKASTPEAVRHLEDALALCQRRRILIVAAAGNDGCACLHVPAAVPTVLAVGAMDDSGQPIEESNWGESYAANGVLAPGADMDVVGPGDSHGKRTGTSYATAVVTSVAARLLSAAKREAYDLDAVDIRSILIDSATPCDGGLDRDCSRVLAGKLNVPAAIELLHSRGKERRSDRPSVSAEQSSSIRGGGPQMEIDSTGVVAAGSASTADKPPMKFADVAGVVQQGCSCGGGGAGCSCGKHDPEEQAKQSGADGLIARSGVGRDVAGEARLVSQQGCGCGGQQQAQLVYPIGALWFDFGSEARYDAIVQAMNDPVAANTPSALIEFLEQNLPSASGITFVLLQDQIPIYAVQPSGPFALDIYKAMLGAMKTSLDPTGDLQRVAIPGVVFGTTRLMNGMTVPVIHPDLRGMVKWQAPELAAAAKDAVGDDDVDETSIFNFLVRVYDELRNLGLSPEERAMNFAATNAYQAATAFADGARRKLELYRIGVKKSPICRPESDCWDVQLVMFDPENERRAARHYRFTVDVSEVLPVTVGRMRTWNAPLGSVV